MFSKNLAKSFGPRVCALSACGTSAGWSYAHSLVCLAFRLTRTWTVRQNKRQQHEALLRSPWDNLHCWKSGKKKKKQATRWRTSRGTLSANVILLRTTECHVTPVYASYTQGVVSLCAMSRNRHGKQSSVEPEVTRSSSSANWSQYSTSVQDVHCRRKSVFFRVFPTVTQQRIQRQGECRYNEPLPSNLYHHFCVRRLQRLTQWIFVWSQ